MTINYTKIISITGIIITIFMIFIWILIIRKVENNKAKALSLYSEVKVRQAMVSKKLCQIFLSELLSITCN